MDSLVYNDQLETVSEQYEPVVLLNLRNGKDRSLINSYLPDSLNIKTSENGIANHFFDLCILDEQAFHQNKQQIEQLKGEGAPIFCPVLVLSKSQSTARTSTSILEYADDVIYTPVGKHILQSRIEMLLQQRKYSLQLQQKTEELEEKNDQLSIFRQALDTANAGVIIADASQQDNPITYCNNGFLEMTGYSEEEVLGRNCRFLQYGDRDQQAIADIRDTIDRDKSGQFQLRNYRKDGSMFWNNLNITPVKNDEGCVTHFLGIQNNVTELVETQQRLEEEKEFIDSAIKSMPGIFYMIDEDQNYIKWNKNLEEELGYNEEEIEKMSVLDFFDEKDHELILSKIEQIVETGSADVEVDIKHANGHSIPFYITGTKFEQSGERYILGTCTNLAELKKAEFKSLQQKQLLDAIINQTESIIYVKDAHGRNQLVNDAYLSLFNIDRDDVIGKTDIEVHGEQHAANVTGNDRQALENGETIEIEEQIPVNGSVRYYHTVKYPLKGVPGYENHICGISTDITAQKQVLDELHERIKEQKCLYNISSLSEQDLTVEQLLKKAVQYLPKGWKHPAIAEASIRYDGKTYKTQNYHDAKWTQTAQSNKINDRPLTLTIAYTEQRQENSERVFLDEERKLLDAIAETLAFQIDRILADHKLKQSEERWKKLVANDPNFILLITEEATIDFLNPAAANFLAGDEPEELRGKSLFDLIELADPDKAKERLQRVLNGEELEPEIYKIFSVEGEPRHLELQSVPITLENGQLGLQIIAQDITSRIEYESELKRNIQEREVLLQEVHHRVKNNLAVVSGLLKIQRFKSEHEELHSILTNCELRIKSMALIHEKLYQSNSLSNIDFQRYIEDLIKSMRETLAVNEGINMQANCEQIWLNINQAVPCGLIISELVTNALQHAFPSQEKGEIEINIKIDGNSMQVQVRDNGIGFSNEQQMEQSMGFTIVRTLVSQLNADMNIQNDGGSTVSFSFERQQIKGSASSIIEQVR